MRKLPKAPRPAKLRTLPTKHKVPSNSKGPRTAAPTHNIQSHTYSPKTGWLEVTFRGGRTYRYEGVSAETADGLDKADSTGTFLHANVIGKHKAIKV